MNKLELLSPAGDKESFYSAINNLADAIYMGLDKYNARRMAKNFTIEEYIQCIKYAHIRGVKIYLTLNTLMNDDEIKEALKDLLLLYQNGLDGVIVQDIGLASLIISNFPDLPVHASTQMTVHNLKQVKYLEKMGFTRVVLARELSIDEIQNICKNTNMQIEVFVHGALCVSYSGQCQMSNVIGGRSANKGMCAQPCRMKYTLYDENDKAIQKEKYILSKKDIYGLEHIYKLIKAGVYSFKIEGRGKNPEYVAMVTRKYRKYINMKSSLVDDTDKLKLMQIFNRDGISYGYLNGISNKESITINSPKNTGLYLGKIIDRKKEYIKIKLEQDLSMHDGIEILDNSNVISTIVTCIKNDKFVNINKDVCKGQVVWIGDIKNKAEVGSSVYKTSSTKLNRELSKSYTDNKFFKKIGINYTIKIEKNKKIYVELRVDNIHFVKSTFDVIPELAKTKSMDKDYVINAFSKLNDTPYEISNVDIYLDDGLFIPVSKLNEIRKNVTSSLENTYDVKKDITVIKNNLNYNLSKIEDTHIAKAKTKENSKKQIYNEIIYINKYDSNKKYDFKLYGNISKIYINACDFLKYENDIFIKIKTNYNLYIHIPNIINKNLEKYIDDNLERLVKKGISGIVCSNMGYINRIVELKQKYNILLVADYSLNITNIYSAKIFKDIGFDVIEAGLDATDEDIAKMVDVCKIELVDDYINAMTTRYCILDAFVKNENCLSRCKNKYYIEDQHKLRYHIICDNTDCTVRLVRRYKTKDSTLNIVGISGVRKSILY